MDEVEDMIDYHDKVKAKLQRHIRRNEQKSQPLTRPRGIKKGANAFENMFGREGEAESESEESNAVRTPLWVPFLAYDGEEQKADYMQVRKGADPPLGTVSSEYCHGSQY